MKNNSVFSVCSVPIFKPHWPKYATNYASTSSLKAVAVCREENKELLKRNFPRIPFPKNKKSFSELAKLGKELRELHLLESSRQNQFITTYPVDGSNVIEEVTYKNGNVFINESQYFGKVPEIAWKFYFGGYQPAQRWLKDRKGKELTNEDIEHYQKIIVALVKTDKIQGEIDKVLKT